MEIIKIGDIVESNYGKTLKILEIARNTYDWLGGDTDLWVLCEDMSGDMPPMWYKVNELKNNKKTSKCECGAQADRHFPNHHSSWCPEFKEDK